MCRHTSPTNATSSIGVCYSTWCFNFTKCAHFTCAPVKRVQSSSWKLSQALITINSPYKWFYWREHRDTSIIRHWGMWVGTLYFQHTFFFWWTASILVKSVLLIKVHHAASPLHANCKYPVPGSQTKTWDVQSVKNKNEFETLTCKK